MPRVCLLLIVLGNVLPGCSKPAPEASATLATAKHPPNIVFVVMDTTRRDRLTVYDSHRTTTPFIARWAGGARVFTNCLSTASTTVPSHVSMFTGLLPSQHGAHNRRLRIADGTPTLAGLLRDAGYQTLLFSANPYIQRRAGIARGFDVVQHPWDEVSADQALEVLRAKVDPHDRSTELAIRLNESGTAPLAKAGRVALQRVDGWLSQRDPDRPFLLFVNWMEAHRPFLPTVENRAAYLSPPQVRRSLEFDRTWPTIWCYTLGVHEYAAEDLALFGLLYDACLRELDQLFGALLEVIDKNGGLENTVVVLTADHGEHLGDHHMLDHQYSVFNELLEVPLIIHYPAGFAPGRDDRPASNLDLFPTLLALAGVAAPDGFDYRGLDLRRLEDQRLRLAAYPAWVPVGIRNVREGNPGFDGKPWQRSLTAFFQGDYKLIHASDDRHALYDLALDPRESHNLAGVEPEALATLLAAFAEYQGGLRQPAASAAPDARMTPAELRRLESLGYVDGSEIEDGDD
jgi:arylsulfatase A-like enzyme